MKWPATALIALAIVAVGCGSSSKKTTATIPSSSPTSTTSTTAAGGSPTDLSQKPSIPKPSAPPPKSLVVKDIVKGHGAVATTGKTVTVQYVGVLYSNGQEFDASWDHGQPFTFPLGGGQVIPGWDKGVVGMRVGGRRQLIIPPNLAYGAQGSGPIGPNETLIFDIDLLKVS